MGDDADSEARERVGRVLNDKWALERVLGIGGMAAVYAARHRNGARAAVKVLHPELARHAEVCERFRREGYAANRVEHPGVVKVLDDDVIVDGPDAGTAYLVMELLQGQSLQERLERGPPIGEREFLVLAASVLDVLEVAHARGVVHRDLKPENLFLLRDPDAGDRTPGAPARTSAARNDGPRVKVLDFGLARLQEGQAITSYGLALGTPSFMSPEQAAGRTDEIDGRTDLFALAATGFRLRTGRRIHDGVNAIELVGKMANVPAPPIRSVAPGVSEVFARVIDRGLQFRREDRHETAAAMRADVLAAIANLDAGVSITQLAFPVSPLARVEAPAAEPTIEASLSDLEPVRAPGESATGAHESSRLARRLTLLALVVIFVGGLFAAKRWLYPPSAVAGRGVVDAGASARDGAGQVAVAQGVLAPAADAASISAPGPAVDDAGSDVATQASTPDAAPAVNAPHGALAPSASPSAAHPSQIARPSPHNAHKLPSVHHAHQTGSKTTAH